MNESQSNTHVLESLSIKIGCDCSEIDKATEKLNRLVELLKEAETLIGSIKG